MRISHCRHEEVISNTSTYGNEKFKAVLTELGVEYPYFDATLFEKYCNKLSARNLLPRPLNSGVHMIVPNSVVFLCFSPYFVNRFLFL